MGILDIGDNALNRTIFRKVIFLIIGLLIFTTVFACSGDKGGDGEGAGGSEAVARDTETPESKPDLDASKIDDMLEKAKRIYLHDEYKVAIEICEDVLDIDADNIGAIVIYGMCESGRGMYDIGNSYFIQATSLTPVSSDDHAYRGIAWMHLGDYKRAVVDYDTSIDIDPGSYRAYSNRGVTYMKLDDHESAIKDFNKAIEISPDYALAYFNRGRVYEQLQEYDAAISDYEKALEIDPEMHRAEKILKSLRASLESG